jgi:hypothetical protein
VVLSSFWPPVRARDRIAAELYQRRNPGIPWLTRDAINYLNDLLKSTDRCLEWGSGHSTAWVSRRVQSLQSIEHDPVWFERVRGELEYNGLDRGTVRLLSIEPVGQPTVSPYVRVIDEFGDGELNVCFVDGEHRAACALAVIPKLASGGLLVIDDAHGVLDHESPSPHSRQGRGPVDGDWARVAALVRSWRSVWTSDGYSDTAFWIKP